MFIKRNKSRPSLRARDSDGEPSGSPLAKTVYTPEDDADISIDAEDDGGNVMFRKKAQKKDKAKASRLSFGGEAVEIGEGTPFKPTKSRLSEQIKDRLHSTPTASTSSTQTPASSSSMYSKEYLDQLKASTPSRAPRKADEDEVDASGLSQLARNKYATRIDDTTEGIPDPVAIAAARQQRQRALEKNKHGGNEEDYIPLGKGQIAIYDDSNKGPHPESRLMREDDEEGDGDEDLAEFTEANDKTYLGRDANKAAARRAKGEKDELIADREAEDEDDEEVREWEEAQARRAGRYEDDIPDQPAKQGYRPAPIPMARPLPTLGPAQARLSKSLADLQLTRTEAENALEVTSRDLANLEEHERELRKEVERVEGKREWVEEFRGWVELLGSFLEEKFPKLEEVEADAAHHLEERAGLVKKRRAADDNDDLSLFLGVPASSDEFVEVDELGRSQGQDEAGPSSGVRRARRADRGARRLRRRARTNRSAEDDGFSTDSTLAEGDAEDYAAAHTNLGRRVSAILEDVKAEDFLDPEKGLARRFGGWRKEYEEEYVNAFGGLAMVQAWEFYARGEMVGWEPLRGSTSIDSFRWFHSLYTYSRPKSTTDGHTHQEDDMDVEDEPPLGPDGDLVAAMVDRAVVPALIKAYEAGAYDPYSAAQTRRAIDLADVVAELMGKDSRKFTSLLKAVLMVFHNHLLDLSSVVIACSSSSAKPSPAFDPASRTAMERYIRRRLKLLRSILLWRRQVPQEVQELIRRLVGEVLKPVLAKSWGGGGMEMAAKVLGVAGPMLSPDLATFLRNGPPRQW